MAARCARRLPQPNQRQALLTRLGATARRGFACSDRTGACSSTAGPPAQPDLRSYRSRPGTLAASISRACSTICSTRSSGRGARRCFAEPRRRPPRCLAGGAAGTRRRPDHGDDAASAPERTPIPLRRHAGRAASIRCCSSPSMRATSAGSCARSGARLGIVLLVTIVVSVLLSLFLARTIALPLRRLARAAHRVRLGRAREVRGAAPAPPVATRSACSLARSAT